MTTRRKSTHRHAHDAHPSRRASYVTPGRRRKRMSYRQRTRIREAFTTFLIFLTVALCYGWMDHVRLSPFTTCLALVWGFIGTALYLSGTN